MNKIKQVVIVGLGYIGLPTAAVVASHGVKVVGVDINQHAVDTINQGKIHIIEPELDAVVDSVVHKGLLRAQTKPAESDYFVIAVPTPFKGDHEPDLSYIESAARSIAPFLKKGNTVILESTSPVGATEQMACWLEECRPDLSFPHTDAEPDIYLAYCPERVLPGKVLEELVNNDRVIGGVTEDCSKKAREFYRIFVKGECIITNSRTAEMCKLTENSFRDVNIAFANELSIICDKHDINVWDLVALANHHPRVNILKPGPGVGGHCIAIDPWFIVSGAPKDAKIIRAAREVNDDKPAFVLQKVNELLDEAKQPVVACLGLTFKADIDDMRESPALQIVCQLPVDKIGELLLVEPNIAALPAGLCNEKTRKCELEEALIQADIVVILVDHREFKEADMSSFLGKKLIDTRGIL